MSLIGMLGKLNSDLAGSEWEAVLVPSGQGGLYLYAVCRNGHVALLEEPEMIDAFLGDLRGGEVDMCKEWAE